MGACSTSTKVISVSCLGLLTGYLSLQSCQTIPSLINYTKQNTLSEIHNAVSNLLKSTKKACLILGSIPTSLLAILFLKSPPSGRHPYLLYAALGAPIALGSLYFNNASTELKLLATQPVPKKKVKSSKDEPSQLDNSVFQNLGEDSEEDIDAEVEKSMIKTSTVEGLNKVKHGYSVAGYIVGAAFGISAIGFFGEFA